MQIWHFRLCLVALGYCLRTPAQLLHSKRKHRSRPAISARAVPTCHRQRGPLKLLFVLYTIPYTIPYHIIYHTIPLGSILCLLSRLQRPQQQPISWFHVPSFSTVSSISSMPQNFYWQLLWLTYIHIMYIHMHIYTYTYISIYIYIHGTSVDIWVAVSTTAATSTWCLLRSIRSGWLCWLAGSPGGKRAEGPESGLQLLNPSSCTYIEGVCNCTEW